MPTAIIELGPHENMSPEQALGVAAREKWEKVLIVGYHSENDCLMVRSSHMSRETALWLAEHMRLYALNL